MAHHDDPEVLPAPRSFGGGTGRTRSRGTCKSEVVSQDLPPELVAAVVHAAELLQRASTDSGRSGEERLEFTMATLDLLSAIDPETVRTMMEPGVPIAIRTWREVDPEGWAAQVDGMTEEQRARLMDLFATHGDDPPEGS